MLLLQAITGSKGGIMKFFRNVLVASAILAALPGHAQIAAFKHIVVIVQENLFYARTHDHSTMGVATGSATVSTNFDVPSGMETGASTLVVIANGIPSAPVSITVN